MRKITSVNGRPISESLHGGKCLLDSTSGEVPHSDKLQTRSRFLPEKRGSRKLAGSQPFLSSRNLISLVIFPFSSSWIPEKKHPNLYWVVLL